MQKILTALSGGIDSAATVLVLRRQGWSPEALYLDITGNARDREKAEEVARTLNVTLHTESVSGIFRDQIVGQVLAEHNAGRTPSPCAQCNPLVKWRFLARTADRLGIRHVATGHYINIVRDGGLYYVARSADPAKDQSYYLWRLGQDILARAVVPLGRYTKKEARQLLREHGLETLARSSESMGVCFLGNMNYDDFLIKNLGEKITPGDVADSAGNIVGSHRGHQLYTIGQKKGFSAAGMKAPQVLRIEPAANRIVVTDDPDKLYSKVLRGTDWQAADPDRLTGSRNLRVAIRGIGRNPEGNCRVAIEPDGTLRVELPDRQAWAAAPGQPMVFYEGEIVIGGALLASSE